MNLSMLTTFDPFFRDFDRFAESLCGRRGLPGLGWMPADAYRHGDELIVRFDLPEIDPDSVDVTVDRNVLSVPAERNWVPAEDDRVLLSERRRASRAAGCT